MTTNLLASFKHYLSSLPLGSISRKLYSADIARFLHWLQASKAPNVVQISLDEVGSPHSYTRYLSHLRAQASAPAVIRRTLASLRQFGTFLSVTHSLPNPTLSLSSSPQLLSPSSQQLFEKYIKLFTDYLNSLHLSPLTIKSYKSDITRYLDYCASNLSSTDLAQVLKSKNRQKYLTYLSQFHSLTPPTLERKDQSLTRFATWYHAVYSPANVPDNLGPLTSTPTTPFHLHSPLTSPDVELTRVKKWNSRIPLVPNLASSSVRNFATLIVLLIFTSTLAIFAYRQFSRDATLTAAYPSTPISPNRQLSFQGRLENSSGTPITTATNMVFKLFTASSGGTELYSTGTCSIDPDADGVFSTQIGDTCGSAITATVFTENQDVWLEVTVGAETLDPRQQIATVAYALNAETLQGFPLSSTVSAIKNTVVPMNQWGEILIGEQSPRLTGVSGTLAISAPALSITTATGTNGNISLAPDGTGVVNVTGNTTTTNFFNVSNAQLTSGSLMTGTVANANTGFKLIDLLSGSSPTSKFSVADTGNTTVGGDLTVTGDDLYMGTNTSGMLLIADGTNFNPTAVSGDITINSSGATAIGDDKVTEADLKVVDTASDEECLTFEATTGDFEWQSCGSGGMTGFTLSGDSGSDQTIGDGNTLEVAGGTGITTAAGATDTITIDFASTELNDLTWGTGANASITWSSALSGATDPTLAFGNDLITVGGDLAVNGATSADLTSSTTTATVFNSTVTNLSLGGAATTLDLAGGSGGTGCTIDGSNGNLTCSGTISGTITATAVPFSGITSATNTSAAMIVGTGASLDFTGSGTINASTLASGTWAIPGTIGSTTPNTGAFTTLSANNTVSFTGTTIGLGTSTTADTINIGTGGTNADDINIGGLATSHTDFTGVVNFAGATTYYVDASGNAKFNDLIVADTGNPGLTIGSSTNAQMLLGDTTLTDNNSTFTIDTPYSVLTIADDLAISGGNITSAVTFDSTATFASTLDANGDVSIAGNLKVGNGTPTVTLNGEDAYIEGTLEVDGVSRFDADISFYPTTGGGFNVSNSANSGSFSRINSSVATLGSALTVGVMLDLSSITNDNGQNVNGIRLLGLGDSTPTSATAINIIESSVNGYYWTTDISLQNGETIDNNTNGEIDLGGQVRVDLNEGASTEAVCSSGNDTGGGGANALLYDCSGAPAADYAEMYPTQNNVEYGDIVSPSSEIVLVKRTDNTTIIENEFVPTPKLGKATTPYQESLIGIVSNNYGDFSSTGHGIVNDADHPRPIALNGRVPVKISPSSAPIQIGDPITSSTDPGRGIKATHSGRIVGTALQTWDPNSPTDTILVFVRNTYYLTLNTSGELNLASISTSQLQTNLLSPLAPDQPIQVQAPIVIHSSTSSTPELVVEGEIATDTISARVAILSDIQADHITANSIVADTISANHIEGLDAKLATLSAELTDSELTSITDRIKDRLASLVGTPSATATELPTPPEATESAIPLPSDYQLPTTASDSATLISLDADFVTINQYLAVIGSSTMTTLTVNQDLFVDKITSQTGTLALQPTGGIINLADSTLIVDSTGSVAVNGTLSVTGALALHPNDSSPLGKLLQIFDEQGLEVASIDASGSATLADVTTQLITIASSGVATPSALTSELTTNATAGESVLLAPNTELTINSPYVTGQTLVYLTPTANTDNKVLFVKSKTDGSFTVAIDSPASSDIPFNWWIIQLELPQ